MFAPVIAVGRTERARLLTAIARFPGHACQARHSRDFDTIGKLEDYKLVDGLERILVIEPNAPEVIVWGRGADRSWRKGVRRGLDQEIAMPEIGVTLPLAEIYDGVEFPARPRLVEEDEESPRA
jgi:hypothetical protein